MPQCPNNPVRFLLGLLLPPPSECSKKSLSLPSLKTIPYDVFHWRQFLDVSSHRETEEILVSVHGQRRLRSSEERVRLR